MKKRFFAAVVAVVLAATCLTGCNGGDSDKINIGGLAPLTGKLSVYGIACNQGIQMAIEEINQAGGVLGKQINYIYEDEKGDNTEAVNAYNKLVQNDQIVALLGDVTTTPTIAVAQEAARDGIPMITATGTGVEITQKGENVFRACFTDPFQGTLMASYAAQKLGAKTAAILYNTADDYSRGLTAAFEETAAQLGLSVVEKVSYTGGDVDFKAQLTQVKAKNPDVFFIPVYYEDAALITVQAKEVGISCTLLGADGWDGVLDKVDESNLDALSKVYLPMHYSSEGTDENLQNFVKKYTEKYNETPNSFAALGYDAAYMMKNAIEKANSTDKAAIVAALKDIEFDGVTGHIVFDENRNPIKRAAITTIADAKYKFVEFFEK